MNFVPRPAPIPKRVIAGLLDFAFERYWSSLSMLGTPRHCAGTLAELAALGCDEAACLVDFGPTPSELERTMTLLATLG